MKEAEAQQFVKLSYNDDDTAVVRINSLEALESLKECGMLYLDFYKEGTNLQSYAELSFDINATEVCGGTLVRLDESNVTTELFRDENGNYYSGPVVETYYGLTFLFHYKGIKSIIEVHSVYQLYCYSNDNKVVFELGSVADAVSTIEYTIPAIPVNFPVSGKDSEFFSPDTDDYILVMMDYPAVASLDFDYSRDMGGAPIYAPCASHLSSYKALALVSYDEFGIKSSKVKLVYENATEAMTAPADRLTWCYLTGSEEGYEAFIADFFEQLISPGEYDGWQYMGRYDAVKYFYDDTTKGAASHEVLSYALNNEFTFDENGFFTDSVSYDYDFPDFTAGHSYIYDDTATITVYSSRQDKRNN